MPISFSKFQVIRKDCFNKKNSFYFFQDGRGDVSYYVAQAVLKPLRSKGSSCLSLVSSWGFRCVTVDPVVSLAFVLWSWVVTISSRMSHIVILGCPLSHPERPTWWLMLGSPHLILNALNSDFLGSSSLSISVRGSSLICHLNSFWHFFFLLPFDLSSFSPLGLILESFPCLGSLGD